MIGIGRARKVMTQILEGLVDHEKGFDFFIPNEIKRHQRVLNNRET